jgi:hypothetical protein
MLKVPRIGGAAQLRLFVEELGFAWACKCIDVHPATMRRWLREETPVPAAALQALYWLTKWGFSDAQAEVHWSHQYLVHKVRQLEAAINWRAPAEWEAANEPAYHAPGLVVPLPLHA